MADDRNYRILNGKKIYQGTPPPAKRKTSLKILEGLKKGEYTTFPSDAKKENLRSYASTYTKFYEKTRVFKYANVENEHRIYRIE